MTSNSEWVIRASKKGDILVSTERRPLSKDVTLIKQVEKNPNILLSALRKKFGTGGTCYGSTVEIQGLLVKKTRDFLLKYPKCFLGIRKDLLPKMETPKEENYQNSDSVFQIQSRKKPRHKRKELGKPHTVDNVRQYENLKCFNSKIRCPQNWPYCSGWCYEPDSEEDDDEKHDPFGMNSFSWLLNDELTDLSSLKQINLEIHDKPMTKSEIELSLKLLGLSASPCNCNDGSINRIKTSQKRDKIIRRQLERFDNLGCSSSLPSSSISKKHETSSTHKPMFQTSLSRDKTENVWSNRKKHGLSHEGISKHIISNRRLENNHRSQQRTNQVIKDDKGWSDVSNDSDECDNDTSSECFHPPPPSSHVFEFNYDNHVASLSLTPYQCDDNVDDDENDHIHEKIFLTSEKKLISKKHQNDYTFPPLKKKNQFKQQSHQQKKNHNHVEANESKELELAIRASVQQKTVENDEEEMLRNAIKESLNIQTNGIEETLLVDESSLCQYVNEKALIEDKVKANKEDRMNSVSFLEALSLLEIMGFPNTSRTRKALLLAEGDDVCFAIELLTCDYNSLLNEDSTSDHEDADHDAHDNQHFSSTSSSLASSSSSSSTSSFSSSSSSSSSSSTFEKDAENIQHGRSEELHMGAQGSRTRLAIDDLSQWLNDNLAKNGIDDVETYSDYIISFLKQLQEEEFIKHNDLDDDKLFQWISMLANLLRDILPDLSEPIAQNFAYDAISMFIVGARI